MRHLNRTFYVALLAATVLQSRQAMAEDTAPKAAPAPAQVVTSGSWSMTLPLGLQAGSAYIPDDNPMTEDKIILGKFLYFDPRLSKDKTISCASLRICSCSGERSKSMERA